MASSQTIPEGFALKASSRSLFVGKQESGSVFSGSLCMLRIIKGRAVYDATSFTPSASGVFSTVDTSLHLFVDSSQFKDHGPKGLQVTPSSVATELNLPVS